jgi:trehalose 6-phosphate phosphatase
MISALQGVLDRLCAAYRHGDPLVLLFDYDGTLTPIVEHPRLAVLDHVVRQTLTSLADRPRVAVGVLSGRQLSDLKARMQLSGLYLAGTIYLAGTGGLELELRGTYIEHPQAKRAAVLIERLAACLQREVAAYEGAWLEKKRLGLAVHYRQVPEHLVTSLRADVDEATGHFGDELRVVEGPRAWEITPVWGWNKGSAVRLILAHAGTAAATVVYAGDAGNDADAMEAVTAVGGITLGIGPDAPASAECRMPDPAALQTFLDELDISLEKQTKVSEKSAPDYVGLYGFWKSTLPATFR